MDKTENTHTKAKQTRKRMEDHQIAAHKTLSNIRNINKDALPAHLQERPPTEACCRLHRIYYIQPSKSNCRPTEPISRQLEGFETFERNAQEHKTERK